MTEVWTLVFINLMFNGSYHEPTVEGYWTYDTMIECFQARSSLGFEFSGVMGSFPGPNARTKHDLRDWLVKITTTLGPNHAPWAFNMITHSSYGRFDDEIALVEEFTPDLVVTALGGPHRVTQQVHPAMRHREQGHEQAAAWTRIGVLKGR